MVNREDKCQILKEAPLTDTYPNKKQRISTNDSFNGDQKNALLQPQDPDRISPFKSPNKPIQQNASQLNSNILSVTQNIGTFSPGDRFISQREGDDGDSQQRLETKIQLFKSDQRGQSSVKYSENDD